MILFFPHGSFLLSCIFGVQYDFKKVKFISSWQKNKTTHELRWDGDKNVVGLVMVRVVVSSHIYFGLERFI